MIFQDNLATMPAIDHLSGLIFSIKRAMWFITFPMRPANKARSSFTMLWRKSLTASWKQRQQNAAWHGLPNMLPMPKPIGQASEY